MSKCKVCNLDLILNKEYLVNSDTFTCTHCNQTSTGLNDVPATYLGLDHRHHGFSAKQSVICPICQSKTNILYLYCNRDDDKKKGPQKPPNGPTSGSLAEVLFSEVLFESVRK